MIARRAIAVAALIAAVSVPAMPAQAAAKRKAQLRAFDSCSGFVHYARRHALTELRLGGVPAPQVVGAPQPQRGAEGGPAPLAQAPGDSTGGGQDFSGTNVQEAGVDEPDLVKTNGRVVYVAANGRLVAVDARSSEPRVLGSLDLDGYGQELLLHGDRVLVLSGAGLYGDVVVPSPPRPMQAASTIAPFFGGKSILREVDVSDPAKMRVVRTLEVDGSYVSARLTGRTARVIFSTPPRAIQEVAPLQATAERRRALRRTTTPSWRPSYRTRRGTRGAVKRRALVACRSIRRPAELSGLNSLTVLTLDMDRGLDPVDSDAILTDGQIVYGASGAIYVATQKLIAEQPGASDPPKGLYTEIHKFDASKAGETTYRGSGVVTGTLLNQFSLSEHDGFLRVASTDAPLWWGPGDNARESQSFVSVLADRGGALTQVGRVGGLGRGERIYAVRFIEDKGYVVTFRQVDPLYVVGLGDPEKPQVLGELKILGYSAYLHPVGKDLLLGVGQDATPEGRTAGTQLSLFDVSDPANPRRVAQRGVGTQSSSDVEYDHRAFLWWEKAGLAVMPVQIWSSEKGQEFAGAIGFKVGAAAIAESGRVSHPADGYTPPVQRSLVVGDRLLTISAAGLKASDLGTFADRGFAAFPQPQPEPAQPQSSPAR